MALPANGDLPQDGSIVSRWVLDEDSGTRVDSVGSNDLTDNNTVLVATTPQFSADAADFEAGNSEYLSKSDEATLSITGDMSMFMWVKMESAPSGGNGMAFMSKFTNASRGYAFRYVDNGGTPSLDFLHSSDGSGTNQRIVAKTLALATWHHVGMVYDASAGEVKFYVDGAQAGATQTGATNSIFDSTAAFNLGSRATTVQTDFVDGLMQDSLIWGAELTAAEVEDLYNLYFNLPDEGDLPQSGSLAARWTLTEDGGTRNDQVGTSHFTDNNTVLSGAGIAEVATAERSADFEAANNEYLTVADNASLSITGDLSFSYWVNFETVAEAYWQQMFSKFDSGTTRSWQHRLYWDGTNITLEMYVSPNANGTGATYANVNWVPTASTWYFLTIVYAASAGETKFFVNGAQQGATQGSQATSIADTTANINIGQWVLTPANHYFDGLMQDLLLWSAALTAAEVTDLYELYTALPKTFTPRTIVIS